MRYQLDTEFDDDGRSITLISIALVAEDGREYYAVSEDFIASAGDDVGPWVREHVLPLLDLTAGIPESRIAEELLAFVGEEPEFWAWYAATDYLLVRRLFGDHFPAGWPSYCRDLRQLADDVGNPVLPPQVGPVHHALEDARHNVVRYDSLIRRRPAALFFDRGWRRALGDGLLAEISERLDFLGRFAAFGKVLIGERAIFDAGRVAFATSAGVEVTVIDANSDFHEFIEAPYMSLGFALALDLDEMIVWAQGLLRAEVVTACIAAIEEQVWAKVTALFALTDSAVRPSAARDAIMAASGAGSFITLELPTGVQAVVREGDLVVIAGGPITGRQSLDGDSWTLTGRLDLCAALNLDGARRIHAEGP